MTPRLGAVAIAAAFSFVADNAALMQKPAGCNDDAHRALDFWIGVWDVRLQDGTRIGTDVVEKALDGCVVLEHWTDVEGNKGESLFYYQPAERVWKQVWVAASGGMKEKRMIAAPSPGAVRFAGKAYLPNGRSIDDRTTLTLQPDGAVRQVIEQCSDGGTTWKVVFDAIHRKR